MDNCTCYRAQILAFGALGYLASPWHRFDGFVSICTLVSTLSLLVVEPRSNVPSHRFWAVLKMMRAARVFRLLRILSSLQLRRDALDKYHLIFSVTSHAAGAMVHFFIYVTAVFYVFAVIGIGCFGGEFGLTQGVSKACTDAAQLPNSILKGTSYDSATYTSVGRCFNDDDDNRTWGDERNVVHSYYYGLNFDTMGNAYVTLLHMLIMNNWHVTHEACVKIVENNARLCSIPSNGEGRGGGWGFESGSTMHSLCVNVHSKWSVSAYFMIFEFYVAMILINILVSFFLDIYAFVLENYTCHFKQARHDNDKRSILGVVNELHHVRKAKNCWMLWRTEPAPSSYLREDSSSRTAVANIGFQQPLPTRQKSGCCRSNYSARKCANCLLTEPSVADVRNVYVPLFVPPFAMFAPKMAFDAVNMCEACRRYWWAIEMLTCKHGSITGESETVSIAEAMSLKEIEQDLLDMKLKTRIMLKTDQPLTSDGGVGDEYEEERQLGIPVVPIMKDTK